jgi:hypothetical protein
LREFSEILQAEYLRTPFYLTRDFLFIVSITGFLLCLAGCYIIYAKVLRHRAVPGAQKAGKGVPRKIGPSYLELTREKSAETAVEHDQMTAEVDIAHDEEHFGDDERDVKKRRGAKKDKEDKKSKREASKKGEKSWQKVKTSSGRAFEEDHEEKDNEAGNLVKDKFL